MEVAVVRMAGLLDSHIDELIDNNSTLESNLIVGVKSKREGRWWKYFDVLGIEANSQGMELFICQFVLMVSVNNDRIDDGPQDWWGFGRAQNEEFPWKMWSSIGGARRGFRGLVPHLIIITIIIKGEVHYRRYGEDLLPSYGRGQPSMWKLVRLNICGITVTRRLLIHSKVVSGLHLKH